MTETLQRQLLAVAALLIAGGALTWLATSSMNDAQVYYWAPTEIAEKGPEKYDATVRLMGMVEDGSVDWKPEEQTLAFRITDGTETVAVRGTGAPPQMFREGIGVVVEGKLGRDEIFRSTTVMVKHSNEYQAPTEGEMPDEVYQALELEGT